MSVASSRPLDVINLEPQSVCLLLKSPPTMKYEPRVWKKESKWMTFRLCLGGQEVEAILMFRWRPCTCIIVA